MNAKFDLYVVMSSGLVKVLSEYSNHSVHFIIKFGVIVEA